jgi:hypothetical protein
MLECTISRYDMHVNVLFNYTCWFELIAFILGFAITLFQIKQTKRFKLQELVHETLICILIKNKIT